MVSRSDETPGIQAPAALPRTRTETATLAELAANDQAPSLIRSALALAVLSHAGQRRESDGAAFIEHPLEVAGLLRDADCSDVVVAAGLLHDLVEDTDVTLADLAARFGADVAHLVQAVSEDPSIPTYRQRKHALREQVRKVGGDAAPLFAADKIAKVRELPDRLRRDQARCGHRARERFERYHELRLEHYQETLRMLQDIAPGDPLVKRLATELDNYQRSRSAPG